MDLQEPAGATKSDTGTEGLSDWKTVLLNERVPGWRKIVIDSFEKWYANQIKHVKVDGPPPCEELRAYSYSVRDIAQMLSIDESSVYYLIKRDQISHPLSPDEYANVIKSLKTISQ